MKTLNIMDGYIFQVIGKLKDYQKVKFVIDNKEFSGILSSKAVKEFYLKEKGIELKNIFLVPESLVSEIEGYDPYELLCNREKFRENVAKQLREIIEDNIYDGDIIILQSVGEYRKKSLNIYFDNNVDNIVSYLTIEISRIFESFNKNIILLGDISTGHNIYTSSLIENLRILITRYKLSNLLQNGTLKTSIVSTPPIIGKTEYRLYFYDYDVRVFFDLPLKNLELENISAPSFIHDNLPSYEKEKIGKELEKEIKLIKDLVRKTAIAFNAIKYNIPLALFYKEIVNLEEEKEGKRALEKILEFYKNKQSINSKENTITKKYIKVKRNLFINTLLTLDLLSSLRKFFVENIESSIKENNVVSIEDLENISTRLYESLNLNINKIFLKRDLKEIKYYACNLLDGEEKLFKELIPKTEKEEIRCENSLQYSVQKRNFFAHSGLLKEYVKLRKEKDTIYLSYTKDYISTIKRWIRKPENDGKDIQIKCITNMQDKL